nr:unnamed protein product [Digitaria exilis]
MPRPAAEEEQSYGHVSKWTSLSVRRRTPPAPPSSPFDSVDLTTHLVLHEKTPARPA